MNRPDTSEESLGQQPVARTARGSRRTRWERILSATIATFSQIPSSDMTHAANFGQIPPQTPNR